MRCINFVIAMEGCEECSYQGKCILDPFGNPGCHCFRWYGGSQCQVNLKGGSSFDAAIFLEDVNLVPI